MSHDMSNDMINDIKEKTDNVDAFSEISLEEAFEKVETVIERLEDEDITLEESFAAYKEGMKLLEYCNRKIDKVEKQVLKINEDGGLDEFSRNIE